VSQREASRRCPVATPSHECADCNNSLLFFVGAVVDMGFKQLENRLLGHLTGEVPAPG